MQGWRRAGLAMAFVTIATAAPLWAQSTAATLSGTVIDEQRNVLPGATVIIRNVDTGLTRGTASDATGNYRIVGLPPGRYEMTVELSGFGRMVQSDIVLSIAQEAQVNAAMKLASVQEEVTVSAEVSPVETTKTQLGRTINTKQIEELPIAGRNFANLSQLTPGVTSTGGAGVAAAGGLTRNNTFLVDGLSNDDDSVATQRGGFSIEAIKEFVVLSNSFTAEYGQAAGAVLNVLTRSGTNAFQGRGFYFHRDDAWDAKSAAIKLLPPERQQKSLFEQKILGGFFGGPIQRDRMFFFGSIEHTIRDQENVVTSPTVTVFRPNDPTVFPQPTRNPAFLGRVDTNVRPGQLLTVRYRVDRETVSNLYIGGNSARDRGTDRFRKDWDIAGLHNMTFGSAALNEIRVQFARRVFDWTVDDYCPKCPTENRPGLNLGKASNMPQGRTEDRIQLVETFTYMLPEAWGDHTFKAGFDASFIDLLSVFHNNLDGTFTFSTIAPFNPALGSTYPTTYTRNDGDPTVRLNNNIYALFVQDQWKPSTHVTVNYGVRWDYEDVVGIEHDKNNFAPRFGISYDPWGDGRTSLRASGGVFYDQIFLNIPLNAENAKKFVQTLITNPGYPDPLGPNPNRTGGPITPIPSTTEFAPNTKTPASRQFSAGLQRELFGNLSLSADFVASRGYNLMHGRDLNYPDLNDPLRRRPNPNFQRITVIETVGNSWYRGLQVGVEKRWSNRHSYTIAYTLSETERDTEDFNFVAVDQRDYSAERGPANNDALHRLSTALNVQLPFDIQFGTLVAARTSLPYNITTGADDNRDTQTNDRPTGVGRNSAREYPFWQLDLKLSKSFRFADRRIEVLAEAFNVTNRMNWNNFDGNQRSATFERPTGGAASRQVQLGFRVDF